MSSTTKQVSNRLLRSVPGETLIRLLPLLQPVALPAEALLQESGTLIDQVLYPESGLISLTAHDGDSSVDLALIGCEGLLGWPLLMDVDVSDYRLQVQLPGSALVLSKAEFTSLCQQDQSFLRQHHRYLHGLFRQISQLALCARRHTIEQRVARWLLTLHDHAGRDHFMIRQEFLAETAGVRRATVNEIARSLQKRGMIRYSRGLMAILDRKLLETASCACYLIIRHLSEPVRL